MTLKDLLKKNPIRVIFGNFQSNKSYLEKNWSIIIYPIILLSIFIIYSVTFNILKDQKKINETNLEKFFNTKEFQGIKKQFFYSLESPYLEFKYKIEMNDSIGKILKKFKIRENEIQLIIQGLKEKKLTNIYAGRELSIVIKKTDEDFNKIVSILYPINNTLSVEIRKNKNSFQINENFLNLTKKEVVIKNAINNNLYSAAVEAGIEPNIIIEFARIYGFEIDFQRDIRR